ncbi:MAG: polyribonucleotide nucleotidyltransferase [Acidimicrobiia bacterium]|nr:polyribonucleotide nucleotidyltransferase [Acidimicrobiia bacterium]
MAETTVRGQVGDKEVALSAGKLALLADGAVTTTIGGTQVLTTAAARREVREGQSFFPLTVDVEERMYSVGRIPGSFFRREGRATEKATLTARLIDRPLRPSFPDGFRSETHVVATVMSADLINPYDVLALNGASAALTISPIPFLGPIGAVRLALSDGVWVAFPTYEELENSVFEIVVAGKRNSSGGIDIAMVEAGATEHGYRLVQDGQQASDEETVARGLEEAKEHIGALIDLQVELSAQLGAGAKEEFPTVADYSDELYERVAGVAVPKLEAMGIVADKHERQNAEKALRDEALAELGLSEDDEDYGSAKEAFRSVQKNVMRARVVNDGVRMDGRGLTDIRQLDIEVGMIDQGHGSAMFQRGETQVINVTTMGMLRMEQMLDTISIEESKRYMHHYNFPPFSTGETGFMRGPKRREIGHGALAEKALLPVIPTAEDFPYAYRLVSEVLMSNGSSSMASVCGSSMSLMDAGVPIAAPVAGIAMGLIAHEGNYVTLTDILGAEDALGDMDFKVAGTRDMITALQLDTKIEGLPAEVLIAAMGQARDARMFILDAMAEVLPEPRPELAPNAPKIEAISIPKDRIGEVIGPKGKTIRELEEETGATIEIDDDGIVRVGASDTASMEAARERILAIGFPPEAEVGKDYEGEVVNITKFGAFVNILPGRDGLLHISKMGGGRRIEQVEDVLALGDKVNVVVREIDDRGKVSLDLAEGVELEVKEGAKTSSGGGDRGGRDRDRGGRDRGGRDRDRGGRDGGRSRDRGGRDRNRDRDRDRDRDRGGRDRDRQGDKPGRTVVSFEDEFEAGI